MRPAQTEESRTNPWVVLAFLILAFFMTVLDTTIVNLANQDIIDRLDASLDEVLWVTSGYTLAFAALLLFAGRLGVLMGARNAFVLGVVVFTAASAACALSQNPEQLIAMRVVQGVGAALLMPQTLAIIMTVFPPDKRGAAFGIWSAVAGLAAVAGPTLGGIFVDALTWRSVFWINVPLGVIAIVGALRTIPGARPPQRPSFQPLGTVLSTVGIFLVVFALIEGERYDWGEVWGIVSIPVIGGAGVLVMVFFVLQQRAQQEHQPLLPFTLLRDRGFSVMNVVLMTNLFASMGLLLPYALYLQGVLDLSPTKAGLVMGPAPLVSLFIAPFAGKWADKLDPRAIIVPGLLVFAGSVAVLIATSHTDSSTWAVIPGMVLFGIAIGLVFAPANALAMRNVPPHLAGAASGVVTSARQIGTVLGAAAVGAVLQAELTDNLKSEPYPDAFVGAMEPSLWLVVGVLCATALLCAVALRRSAVRTGDDPSAAEPVKEPTG
ncbi:MFS transporter [Streptomyces sp. 184]|uniref:MFS transporter n=1 Tax=Streptomyces sp. 184 TaxID=1827526 RepID=UPI0038916A87